MKLAEQSLAEGLHPRLIAEASPAEKQLKWSFSFSLLFHDA